MKMSSLISLLRPRTYLSCWLRKPIFAWKTFADAPKSFPSSYHIFVVFPPLPNPHADFFSQILYFWWTSNQYAHRDETSFGHLCCHMTSVSKRPICHVGTFCCSSYRNFHRNREKEKKQEENDFGSVQFIPQNLLNLFVFRFTFSFPLFLISFPELIVIAIFVVMHSYEMWFLLLSQVCRYGDRFFVRMEAEGGPIQSL